MLNPGRPEPPGNIRIGYVNGIGDTFKYHIQDVDYLSNAAKRYAVHSCFVPTVGFFGDLRRCRLGLYSFKCTEAEGLIHQEWDNFFDGNTPDARYLMIAHSGGAIKVRNALLTYDQERRKQISIVAIAPGAYIYKDTCASVIHYRVDMYHDIVPYLDGSGCNKAEREGTIRTLECMKGGFQGGHSILNPTYHKKLEKDILDFMIKGIQKK